MIFIKNQFQKGGLPDKQKKWSLNNVTFSNYAFNMSINWTIPWKMAIITSSLLVTMPSWRSGVEGGIGEIPGMPPNAKCSSPSRACVGV